MMLQRKLKYYGKFIVINALFFCSINSVKSQVTIGSALPPAKGALLDLKENMDGLSAKGLQLPRVELLTKNIIEGQTSLASTIKEAKGDWDKEMHEGLLVYHTNRCTIEGNGLYVWTGNEWRKMGAGNLAGININKTYFDLASGYDARGEIRPQYLSINWQPVGPELVYVANNTIGEGVPFLGANALPSSPLVDNPYKIELLPSAMTIVDPTNPWLSRETVLTFSHECGNTDITLNQTNFALKVNESFNNSFKKLINSGEKFGIIGNSAWTATGYDPERFIISVTPDLGTINGEDRKDGTIIDRSLTILTNVETDRYKTAYVTFKDTATIKRFNDITVSLLNCDSKKNDLTLEQWAERAGFSSSEIDAAKAVSGYTSDVKENGIQLHSDQDKNIFLSGYFGTTAGRWMLNNLSAKKFDTLRLVSEEIVNQIPDEGFGVPDAPKISSNGFKDPIWCYPEEMTTSAIYVKNKRLGLLYNWAAATNSKGGSNGKATINDGEDQNLNPTIVQGICPYGWHLPSDYEWTQLEQEIQDNTNLYSNLSDTEAFSIEIGLEGERGIDQGRAMLDPCPTPGMPWDRVSEPYTTGESNIINSDAETRPGMQVLQAGCVRYGVNHNFGYASHFYTASGSSSSKAWVRSIWVPMADGPRKAVYRATQERNALYSVRCKKND